MFPYACHRVLFVSICTSVRGLLLFVAHQINSRRGKRGKLPDEQRLLRKILYNYDTAARPVYNASHTVTVQFGLTLTQISDMVCRLVLLLNWVFFFLTNFSWSSSMVSLTCSVFHDYDTYVHILYISFIEICVLICYPPGALCCMSTALHSF